MNKHTWGTIADSKESLRVAAVMLLVTALYQFLMSTAIPDYTINWYEFFGTWFTLNAVWLVRTQNIQNWLWGIAGVILLGLFFKEIGLPGQQWLQWAYFLPVQIWSWYHWVQGQTAEANLPVTMLSGLERLACLAIIFLIGVGVYVAIDIVAPSSVYPVLDATVVAASIVAQYLMGLKKMESWLLWLGPVNLLSIILFYLAGAYVLTALYVAFFIHAIFGVRGWYRAAKPYSYETV